MEGGTDRQIEDLKAGVSFSPSSNSRPHLVAASYCGKLSEMIVSLDGQEGSTVHLMNILYSPAVYSGSRDPSGR